MTRHALALFSFIVLAGFLGVLAWNVPRADLIIVIMLTLLLAAYDFFVHRES